MEKYNPVIIIIGILAGAIWAWLSLKRIPTQQRGLGLSQELALSELRDSAAAVERAWHHQLRKVDNTRDKSERLGEALTAMFNAMTDIGLKYREASLQSERFIATSLTTLSASYNKYYLFNESSTPLSVTAAVGVSRAVRDLVSAIREQSISTSYRHLSTIAYILRTKEMPDSSRLTPSSSPLPNLYELQRQLENAAIGDLADIKAQYSLVCDKLLELSRHHVDPGLMSLYYAMNGYETYLSADVTTCGRCARLLAQWIAARVANSASREYSALCDIITLAQRQRAYKDDRSLIVRPR